MDLSIHDDHSMHHDVMPRQGAGMDHSEHEGHGGHDMPMSMEHAMSMSVRKFNNSFKVQEKKSIKYLIPVSFWYDRNRII